MALELNESSRQDGNIIDASLGFKESVIQVDNSGVELQVD